MTTSFQLRVCLIPPPFIEVPVGKPGNWVVKYMCVLKGYLFCLCFYDFLLNFGTVLTVWYFRTVLTVWYFRTVLTVWYFRTVLTVWYFRTVLTVWYFRTVLRVWYFRTVLTVWYFLFFMKFRKLTNCQFDDFLLSG